MTEYTVGRATTRKRKRTTCNITVSVNPQVYRRLEAMARAIEHEWPGLEVSIGAMARRILYAHPALRKLAAHRHQQSPEAPKEVER